MSDKTSELLASCAALIARWLVILALLDEDEAEALAATALDEVCDTWGGRAFYVSRPAVMVRNSVALLGDLLAGRPGQRLSAQEAAVKLGRGRDGVSAAIRTLCEAGAASREATGRLSRWVVFMSIDQARKWLDGGDAAYVTPERSGASARDPTAMFAGFASVICRLLIEQGAAGEKKALEVAEQIRGEIEKSWAGQALYLPRQSEKKIAQRDWEIYRRFHTGAAQELASEYGLSYVRVHQIAAKCRRIIQARAKEGASAPEASTSGRYRVSTSTTD